MTLNGTVEFVYLVTGLALPFFYLPQIVKLQQDSSRLSSYSFSKSSAQLILRVPALVFSVLVVQSPFMNIVLIFDLLGRCVEWLTAIAAMQRQGFSNRDMAHHLFPFLAPKNGSRQAGEDAEQSSIFQDLKRCRSQIVNLVPGYWPNRTTHFSGEKDFQAEIPANLAGKEDIKLEKE